MDFVRRQQTPSSSPPASISVDPSAGKSECFTTIWAGNTTQTLPLRCSTTPTPAASSQPAQIPGGNGGTSNSVAVQPSQGHVSTVPGSTSTAIARVSSEGLSGGAVAGVAIGMLVAGVLIAGGVFFFLLRRQKKRQAAAAAYQMHHVPYNGTTTSPEKSPAVVTSAVASSIDDLLPQPVADDTITDEISKIRDNIKNHVRTYYHSTPVSTAGIHEIVLRDLAAATGVSPSVIGSSLANPSTRQDAIRLVLGWVVLSKSLGERDASLLPADLSRLVASIQGGDGKNSTQSILYSKWKTITGVLLQQRFGKNAQDPNRAQTFANTVAELDSTLAPFVQGNVDGGQRRRNLDMILTRTANFAFLLFTQPGSFQFDFSSGYGGLVAFPALVQTTGDQGQVLSPFRVLIEREVAA